MEEEPEADAAAKVMCFAGVPKDFVQSSELRANEWVTAALAPCGGRGGGKDTMGQGQGMDASKLDEAVEKAKSFAMERLFG
jgi:alanyl-tRNA synthetase